MMSAPLVFSESSLLLFVVAIGSWRSLLKGVALTLAAACAHHVTLIFGSVLFALTGLWLACSDARKTAVPPQPSLVGLSLFVALTIVGVGSCSCLTGSRILRHPIEQMPIPHASR